MGWWAKFFQDSKWILCVSFAHPNLIAITATNQTSIQGKWTRLIIFLLCLPAECGILHSQF